MWEMLVSYWWLLACLVVLCFFLFWVNDAYRMRLERQEGNSPIYVLKTASELMSLTDSGDIIWEFRSSTGDDWSYSYFFCHLPPNKTVRIYPPTFWKGFVLRMEKGKTSKGAYTLPFEAGKELFQKAEHSIEFVERK